MQIKNIFNIVNCRLNSLYLHQYTNFKARKVSMNILEKFGSWWRMFYKRRRVSVTNTTNKKVWQTYISPARVVTVVCAVVIIFLALILLLVSYTPVLEVLPAYKTEADRTRDELVDNIIRLDSMERIIDDIILYNNNVALIMEGKTPSVRSSLLTDTVKIKKGTVARTGADSLLREQMEGDGPYSLKNSTSEGFSQSLAYATPIDGIITESFDPSNNRYGVKIAATTEAPILAVESGIVAMSMWTPDDGYIIQIIHTNNSISFYRNLSESIVSTGEAVKRGEIIGYNSKAGEDSAEKLFEFELWSNGRPSNPERFIIF